MSETPQIGVIFDCDGTLIDSMGAWHDVDRKIAEEAGVTLTPEDADRITTMSLSEAGAYMHKVCGLGGSPKGMEQIILDHMQDFYEHEAQARPGALAFVQALAAAGVPMVVASSTPPNLLEPAIERCGFAPYMKAVLSVDLLGTSKREPAIYDYAANILGTDRAHTWAFEDAAYANRTLQDAGFHSVGIYDNDISGQRDDLRKLADIYIESFEDISAGEFLDRAKTTA